MSSGNIKYVYELPFCERSELCKILNQNDDWEELAGKWMKFDVLTIQSLRKNKNPTDELLNMWGNQNHMVSELFVLLYRMKHYRLLSCLKPFVDSKFHVLIRNGEGNILKATNKPMINANAKDLKIGVQNFNKITPPPLNVPKVILDDNSSKILNRPVQNAQAKYTPSNSNNLLAVSPLGFPTPSSVQRVIHNIKQHNEVPLLNGEATLPQTTYNELTIATNGWSKHNILGRGGFGTVYRGVWKNTDVAVKKIERRMLDSSESYLIQIQQSLREIKILNSRPHENILSLYAYSFGGDAPCLVYQLMKNGSLEDKLLLKQKCQPLSWIQRHEIAKGTARGLQYLHTIGEKPLIHGDIKSANILLDKNLEPKIGDFGLSREGPEKDSMKVSKIHGTRPYLPDEFLHGKRLSTKIDTYSYGIVLFEIATGLSAYDDSRSEHKFLKSFIDSFEEKDIPLLIDKKAGERDKQVYDNLIVLGKWCANKLAQHRPEMELVFQKLNEL